MPIDVQAFEEGVEYGSIEREIIRFLYANEGSAFDVYEITAAATDQEWCESETSESFETELSVAQILDVATVNSILERLVHNGGVDRRVVDDGSGERPFYRAVV